MRIVVKVGTSTLTHPTGRLDIRHVETLCKVLSDVKNAGHEIVLVSSGAIGMGVGKLNLRERPSDMPTKQAAAAVVLLPFVMSIRVQPSVSDILLLLFLGIITTALAHTLFIHSLKTLPAQIAGVCSAMETVYGILFALLLLGEIPTVREILGAVIIIGTVLIAQTRTE